MNESTPSEPDFKNANSNLERARLLLGLLKPGTPLPCLFSTVSADGRPHTDWMYASRSPDSDTELLSITSPDSDKIRSLHTNRQVEWLITSRDRLQQLYLEGDAEVVEKVSEIRRLWSMIGDKQQVYFMKYYNSGLGFSILRTRMTSAIYVAPERKQKTRFDIGEVAAIT